MDAQRPMDALVDKRRATSPVVVLVALFLLAVILGRLLMMGDWAWWLAAPMLALVLLFLARRTTWPIALVVTGLFTAAMVALGIYLRHMGTGWVGLLLLPAVGLAVVVAASVVKRLLRPAA